MTRNFLAVENHPRKGASVSNLPSSFSSDLALQILHLYPVGRVPPVWRCLFVDLARNP